MMTRVQIEGRDAPLLVEVVEDRGDRVVVRVDGRVLELSVQALADGALLLDRQGRLDRVDVLGDGPAVEVLYGRRALRATVMDERDTWLRGGAGTDGAGTVTVAMPGKVVALDVSEGDTVQRGQRLLVIEAMKMENDVKSPRDGVVSAIRVAPGDAVEAGQTLMELEQVAALEQAAAHEQATEIEAAASRPVRR